MLIFRLSVFITHREVESLSSVGKMPSEKMQKKCNWCEHTTPKTVFDQNEHALQPRIPKYTHK